MKTSNLGLISLSCLALSSCSEKQPSVKKENQKPNILVFFTDDNQFDYWGFSGGINLSPNIDQLAVEGMECTQFYSNSPVSTPSRYNLQTGKFSGRCKNESFLKENPTSEPYRITWNTFLDPDKESTLGDIFSANGYSTGFVGKWHLGQNQGEKYNFKADDDPKDPVIDKKLKDYQQDIVNEVKSNGYEYAASITPFNNDWHTVEAVNVHNLEWYAKGSIDFLKEYGEKKDPFFLIVNLTTHHGPCIRTALKTDVSLTQAGYVDGLDGIMPPRETVFERIEERNYPITFKTTGTVWTDDFVKAVVDQLKKQGLYDNTMIVFTTDHNSGVQGKATCYNAGNHIPCIISYPGVLPAGSRFNEQFQIVDLLPTFMDACHIEMPADNKIDGISMWDYMLGKKYNSQRPLFIEFGYSRAIIDGDWKYIAIRYPDELVNNMKTGKTDNIAYNVQGKVTDCEHAMLKFSHYFDPDQLYNLNRDPGEQINLAGEEEYQEKLAEMKKKLAEITNDFDHPFDIEDSVDPFFYTKKFEQMCKNARENIHCEKYYWYSQECY